MTPEERFWSKVNKAGPIPLHNPDLGPCWEWIGYRDRAGYGRFALTHRDNRRLAPRVSLAWATGRALLPTEHTRHQCDNPACVRPSHLLIGTPKDNQDDINVRNRRTNAHLSFEKAATIRDLIATGHRRIDIAQQFGVSRASINDIVKGRTWIAR